MKVVVICAALFLFALLAVSVAADSDCEKVCKQARKVCKNFAGDNDDLEDACDNSYDACKDTCKNCSKACKATKKNCTKAFKESYKAKLITKDAYKQGKKDCKTAEKSCKKFCD